VIHDEKTIEIEIPKPAPTFQRRATDRKPAAPAATATATKFEGPDFTSPWGLRLIAVVVILILSLFVI
jgi:hypothetical protein